MTTLSLTRIPRKLRAPALILAALLAAAALNAVDGRTFPPGVLLQGAELGAVNGLLALGLVLTYRANRVINFSYGAMGAAAGTFGVMLNLGHHVNWFLCVLVGIVLGGLLGAAVDVFVMRRFFNAPRLVVTVATIGLAQVLGGIQLLEPGWLGGPPLVGGFQTPLSSHHVLIHPVLFNGDDLLIAAVVPLVLAGLGWFLLRTDAGVAVRSVADNSDRAMLLGIPVKRLSTLVWVIAGALAALTVLVNAPSQGLTLSAGAGPQLLLLPLAAAVVARMERLPVAFGAAVALGVVDSIIGFNVSKQSVTDLVNFAVILLALLAQRKASGRARDSEESWLATGTMKPIPSILRRLPEVVAARAAVLVAVVAVAVVVPLVSGPGTVLQYTVAVILGIVAVSLVLLSGWSGSISLGQMAFAGVGGVVAGNLIEKANLDLFLSLVVAGAVGAVLAVLVGFPALRIRGVFLAVVTLALAVAVDDFFINPTNFESAIPQSFLRPVLWKRFDLANGRAFYFLCLGILAVVILFVQGIRRARAGRVLLATRDNEKAAGAVAVPTVRTKLVGFVLAGTIAGMAGALYAVALRSIGQHTFPSSDSLLVFSMAVIGGLGSVSGALMGVALIEVASHAFPQYQLLITGSGLLVLLLILPGGLGEAVNRIRDRLLRVVAERRGILVPSLVADRRERAADEYPAEADTAEIPAVAAELLLDDEFAGSAPGGPAPPLLRCRKVEVSYGPVQILFGVDLDVERGEIVALLGTNGAGKSTLLKGVSGLVKVGRGSVEFDGKAITGNSPEAVARQGLSLMPGGRGVFPTLTIEENLRLGAWMVRKDRGEAESARQRVLELFPVLEQRRLQQAGNLSGGEQQMLSLAMALMVKPEILMIDELSLGLAPTIVAQLLEVVRDLHAQGTTIVVVEQSVNVALELAHRAVFLEKGEVRFSGPTAELLDRPDILRSVFIAGASAVTGSEPDDSDADGVGAAGAPAVHAGVGAALAADEPRTAPPEDAPVVLECRHVVKRFGGIVASNEVSLGLRQGEILGLIGHNGAGKTTLMDLISGFLPVDGGRILLGGADIGAWPCHLRAAAGLGRTFQEARLYPSLTVEETIAVALERHLDSRDLVAAGLRLPASLDSEVKVADRVAELIGVMSLEAFREKLTGELSTGTRRIVELACVLAQDPAVLLLDEPSGGVAQRETEAMGPLLQRVQQHSGCSILVIEHDMPLLSSICDRMIALELGEVIAEGTPAEVLAHPRVIDSYLGTDESTINRSGALTPATAGAPSS